MLLARIGRAISSANKMNHELLADASSSHICQVLYDDKETCGSSLVRVFRGPWKMRA
jgi:hypothetical protein